MFSMLSSIFNFEEKKQENMDIENVVIREHIEGTDLQENSDLQKNINTSPQTDEVPFKYSIKSTSNERFTHPEQYEAQMNWRPPDAPIVEDNDLYTSSNLRGYGPHDRAYSSSNLKLYSHNKKLHNLLKKRRIVRVQREDPTSIENLFGNESDDFM